MEMASFLSVFYQSYGIDRRGKRGGSPLQDWALKKPGACGTAFHFVWRAWRRTFQNWYYSQRSSVLYTKK